MGFIQPAWDIYSIAVMAQSLHTEMQGRTYYIESWTWNQSFARIIARWWNGTGYTPQALVWSPAPGY